MVGKLDATVACYPTGNAVNSRRAQGRITASETRAGTASGSADAETENLLDGRREAVRQEKKRAGLSCAGRRD